MIQTDHTIAAVSTATGGAISLIRMSGNRSTAIIEKLFSRKISEERKCYFGNFTDGKGRIVDEVVVSYYKGPRSYTGEDMIEISCHGSKYLTREILRLLIDNGASPATAGEFTKRAFLNGKMNLSEAEAVCDLIASESRASAEVALSQMRGGYSLELSSLREKLLHIASLFELEMDFSEEDVEFASRTEMKGILSDIKAKCDKLTESFSLGNALKNGIPVAIVGRPNVGKSTLLNAIVGSERSIVSDIAGTTRDYIDETVNICNVMFRFIDTAGLRQTENTVEAIGVERSFEQISKARVVINMTTPGNEFEKIQLRESQKELRIVNKSDESQYIDQNSGEVYVSAKYVRGIDLVINKLTELSGVNGWNHESTVVSNARHYELLKQTSSTISEILYGIDNSLSSDILSHLLRDALQCIGTITGEFTTDEILGNIFSHFCIGK